MPEEEKTTVEEKTVEEEKAEVEETEVEEKTVEEKTVEETKVETKTDETKVKEGDGESTKTSGEPPSVTYEDVMDFIERHHLPEGLALGESMTIVADAYYQGSKTSTTRYVVFGMGQTTDADFGKDDPAEWSDEFARALHVGDVATGVVNYQYFGDYPEKGVISLPFRLGEFSTDCITYFGLMAGLCAMEKEALGGGKKIQTPTENTFTVSDVGCSMPSRDKQCFHLGIVAECWSR